MKLTVHTFLTLDGVMQGPGGADEDRTGGFDRGGWLIPFSDADMGEIVESWFARTEAVLLGRNTYETMRAYWSQVTDPASGPATKLNYGRKYVASNTLTDADWGDTTVLSGDVIAQVTDLKKQGGEGELQVHGSALLAQSLHTAGLIDEYRLLVFPVTVGAGKRLFTDHAPALGYTLLESRITGTGVQYQALAPKAFQAGGLTVQEGKEVAL
jgi:dihydrofolate reductase